MSKQDFGGKMTLRASDGEIFSIRTTVNYNPADVSIEAVTNQDGSVDRVATIMSPTVELTFADRGYDYSKLLKAPRQNFSIEEEFTDVTFFFTSGFLTGAPQVNRLNGEVTGISVTAAKIRRRG